jgi:hypothetical protein
MERSSVSPGGASAEAQLYLAVTWSYQLVGGERKWRQRRRRRWRYEGSVDDVVVVVAVAVVIVVRGLAVVVGPRQGRQQYVGKLAGGLLGAESGRGENTSLPVSIDQLRYGSSNNRSGNGRKLVLRAAAIPVARRAKAKPDFGGRT